MPVVIAVANQKGGCGKTTVSMNVAGCMAQAGYKVLLIDADPQQSAMNWRNNLEEPKIQFDIALYPFPNLHVEVNQRFMQKAYDVILIDCPPGASHGESRKADITRSALLCAHLVLMPIRPTPIDYQASRTLIPLLQDVSFGRAGRPLPVYVVINGKPPARTRLGAEAQQSAKDLFTAEGIDFRVMKSELCVRQSLAEAPLYGQAVVDFDPNSKAAEEIQALTAEVMECLSQSVAA